MDHEKDLEKLRPKFEALTADDIRPLDIPMKVAIQEAEDTLNQAIKDKVLLLARGLNPSYISDTHEVIGAARQAQSNWNATRHSKELSDMQWLEQAPIAVSLRDEVIEELGFAFFGNSTLMSRINDIKQGKGDADTIQDLNDLKVLASLNMGLLKITNFDNKLLVKIDNTTDVMANLLAEANSYKGENNNDKLLRDKAYTYLHAIISEIRRVGKFVFRNNPEHAAAYASAYYRKK